MREISRQSQIRERGDGAARSESQLAFPIIRETGGESTAQQPQQQQQQQLKSEENWMVSMVDAGKAKVEFETGDKWLEDLVVKLCYEQYLSGSVGRPAAEPVDVWARVGVGTRWLVSVKDAGCGRHGHPGGESFPPFAPD